MYLELAFTKVVLYLFKWMEIWKAESDLQVQKVSGNSPKEGQLNANRQIIIRNYVCLALKA